MDNLTIALDAMSGDFGPRVTVPAAVHALNRYPNLTLFLVGEPTEIVPLLPKKISYHIESQTVNSLKSDHRKNSSETDIPSNKVRLIITPSTSVISNNIKPSQAVRHSQGSSMRIALELVKDKRAEACISAGNTGALMGLSKLLLHAIKGIDRPALVASLPTLNHKNMIVLDLGANAECNSDMLVQFATMGSILSNSLYGIKNPRVALLNIGIEESKGLDKIRSAAMILNANSINYIGYLEGNELLSGKTDVLVCDGFVGNVTLKTVEGLMRIFMSPFTLSNQKHSFFTKLTNFWLQKKISKNFGYLDPERYNGACLLGLQSIVIKSHGGANQKLLFSAIEQAILAIKQNIPDRIAASLSSILTNSENQLNER
ncbi:phosphate acyltransferase PlsX [Orbaceae bacterium ESL0721]|nr:phosphate acyltransferase PlsX [Orbaceae bacterium ESL0721]